MKTLDIRYRETGREKIKQADCSKFNSTYDLLKHHVNGYIDCVAVGELDIWVDDEGLLKQLPLNIIVKRSRTPELTNYDSVLVGPVVFASRNEEGDTIGLTPKAIEILDNMQKAFAGPYPVYLIEDYRD